MVISVNDPLSGKPYQRACQWTEFSSGTVAPFNTIICFTLARARIQDWREFEDSLSQRVAPGQEWPTPRERQVLAYHKKYGTTSPLYEKIRAKYPDW